jgi:NADPH-dependent 2,4-dienoyl-CoA reductase/sulfur reductase-like enzyme
MCRLSTLAVAALTLTQPCSLVSARELRASKVFHSARQVEGEYDYVIVGGGTAGLTVADRLTEDGKTTVLVLEYGQLSRPSITHTTKSKGTSNTEPPQATRPPSRQYRAGSWACRTHPCSTT